MKKITAEDVVQTVCRATGISVIEVLYKQTRRQDITDCRHIIYYFIRRYVASNMRDDMPFQYEEIAKMFKKNHATIIFGVNKIEGFIRNNKKFRSQMEELNRIILNLRDKSICPMCGCEKKEVNSLVPEVAC
jgi:chromosomal replication initiator protein